MTTREQPLSADRIASDHMHAPSMRAIAMGFHRGQARQSTARRLHMSAHDSSRRQWETLPFCALCSEVPTHRIGSDCPFISGARSPLSLLTARGSLCEIRAREPERQISRPNLAAKSHHQRLAGSRVRRNLHSGPLTSSQLWHSRSNARMCAWARVPLLGARAPVPEARRSH